MISLPHHRTFSSLCGGLGLLALGIAFVPTFLNITVPGQAAWVAVLALGAVVSNALFFASIVTNAAPDGIAPFRTAFCALLGVTPALIAFLMIAGPSGGYHAYGLIAIAVFVIAVAVSGFIAEVRCEPPSREVLKQIEQ